MNYFKFIKNHEFYNCELIIPFHAVTAVGVFKAEDGTITGLTISHLPRDTTGNSYDVNDENKKEELESLTNMYMAYLGWLHGQNEIHGCTLEMKGPNET